MILADTLRTLAKLKEDGHTFCMLPDAYNPALLGYFYDSTNGCYRVVYDQLLLKHVVSIDQNIDFEDAWAWFDTNVFALYVDPAPPAYIERRVNI